MPSANNKELRRVVSLCEGTNLRFRTVPDLVDIASGKVRVSQMRDVDINDVLGREPVTLDMDIISDFIRDKVVLITGAGGSIGSEMCRQVGNFRPKMLHLGGAVGELSVFYRAGVAAEFSGYGSSGDDL